MTPLRLRRGSGIVGRVLDDTLFLVHLKTNRIIELNDTGARLWELLANDQTLAELVSALAREYDAPATEIERDLGDLIEQLRAQRFVESVVAPRFEPAIAESTTALPPGAWVLRWDASSPLMPELVAGAACTSVTAQVTGAGDLAVLDGYLFRGADDDRDDAARAGAAYGAHGAAGLDSLRGAYCAAIWDRRAASLTVARDASGIAPCFYVWTGQTLLVSSTLDGLLAQPEVTRRINEVAVAEYLAGIHCPAQLSETLLRDVHRLPVGHRLRVTGHGPRLERGWDPVADDFEWASAAEIAALPELFEQAVARCRSVGADAVALSGGFDSISIAAVAADLAAATRTPIPTALSMHFEGGGSDESPTQRAVARALGMELQLLPFPAEARDEFVTRALADTTAASGPILSPWQWMYEPLLGAARARRLGAAIMMGTGGDETFNVDPAYATDLLSRRDWRGLYGFVRAWQRTSGHPPTRVVSELLWNEGLRRLAVDAARARTPSLIAPLQRRLGRGADSWARHLGLRGDLLEAIASRQREAAPARGRATSHYRRAVAGILRSPALTAEFDQAGWWSRRAGVRLCYPFFDPDLLALTLRLPPKALYDRGRMKAPLRDWVARRLPGVAIPPKKLDFTAAADELMAASGPRAWRDLDPPRILGEHGLLEPARLAALRGDTGALALAGKFWRSWAILSATRWLTALNP